MNSHTKNSYHKWFIIRLISIVTCLLTVYSTNLQLIVSVDNMGPSCPKSISINVEDIANARNSATKNVLHVFQSNHLVFHDLYI